MGGDTSKKTDVLNLRLEPGLAAEIQRIADWRETSSSEVARELLRHGIAVERQLQAQELRRGYDYSKITRNPNTGYLKVEAAWITYSLRELAELEEIMADVPAE